MTNFKTLLVSVFTNNRVRTLPIAFDLPVGTVYSYGEMRVHYMRIQRGSIVLTGDDIGGFISDSISTRYIGTNPPVPSNHHRQHVEVCDAELTIRNP